MLKFENETKHHLGAIITKKKKRLMRKSTKLVNLLDNKFEDFVMQKQEQKNKIQILDQKMNLNGFSKSENSETGEMVDKK